MTKKISDFTDKAAYSKYLINRSIRRRTFLVSFRIEEEFLSAFEKYLKIKKMAKTEFFKKFLERTLKKEGLL